MINLLTIEGLMIPFLGTALGSLCVLFILKVV